ncbi:MAG: efflux RND transporter periplasmic adaptor subunit [Opitutales bacterium]
MSTPDLESVLGEGSDPAAFWSRFAQALAEGWQLAPAFFLHVGGSNRVGLLGQSSGSDPAAIPATVQRAVLEGGAPGATPRHLDAIDRRWFLIPLARKPGGVVFVAGVERDTPLERAAELKVAADAILAAFEATHTAAEHEQSVTRLTQVLDLGLLVGEAGHFDKAANALCNEVANRFEATRVTLGWKVNDRLKLIATSHGGRVRNDTELAGALIRAMDEALIQDREILYPAEDDTTGPITEQHRAYAGVRPGMRLLSFPLRSQQRGVGVLTIEAAEEAGPLSALQADALRVSLDLVTPHLEELHRRVGWVGARLWRATRRWAGGFLGYRHTAWKLAGAVLLLAFLLSLVIRIEHKVRAPFILKTTSSAQLTAPFAGYIETVHHQVGDVVEAGAVLVELDRRELLVQRAEYEAERDRSLNEARRFEAEGDLSEMRLAQLAAQQAEARLQVVEFRLSRAVLRAPFEGIIVEGDLNERLSSPTQVGETLLQLVRLDGIYAELQVDEQDINYLEPGMDGRLAFTSRPATRFTVRLEQFEPVAVVEETGTTFRVRVFLVDEAADWWRPGMSGICRVEVGPRSIAWILFHRTIDWIRLWFWW